MWNVSSYMQKWTTAMECGEPLTVDQLIERLQIISAFGHGGDIVKVYMEDTQSYDPVVGCFQRVYLKCLSRRGLMVAYIDVNRTIENIERMKNFGSKYFRAEADEAAIKECLAQINREIERRKTVL